MPDDTTNSPFGIAGDPEAAGRLIRSLSARNAEAMRAGLDQQLRAAQEGLASWTQNFTQQMNVAETAMKAFKATSDTMFTGLAGGMTRSISNATTYSKSIGDAVDKALKSTLTALTSEAVVRALYNTGLGFYFLAVQAYDQAAQAFEAAAVFGSIAGVAAGLGSALPGGGAGAGRGARLGSRTTGAESPTPAPAAGGNVTVMVVGEAQAATWLTRVINTGVEQHGARLVASHTKRSAPAGR
jgi:hypothetical protein